MNIDEIVDLLSKYETKANECIDLATKYKNGYIYWKNRNGLKALVNKNLFRFCNRTMCKLAKSYLDMEAKWLIKLLDDVINEES